MRFLSNQTDDLRLELRQILENIQISIPNEKVLIQSDSKMNSIIADLDRTETEINEIRKQLLIRKSRKG